MQPIMWDSSWCESADVIAKFSAQASAEPIKLPGDRPCCGRQHDRHRQQAAELLTRRSPHLTFPWASFKQRRRALRGPARHEHFEIVGLHALAAFSEIASAELASHVC